MAKEEFEETVEYSFDPILDMDLKGEFVFTCLPLRIHLVLFPASLGAWVQAGLGKKSSKTNSPKVPVSCAVEPAGALAMLDTPSLQVWLWSRCVFKTVLTTGVSDTGRQVWDMKNTGFSSMARCVRSSFSCWTPGSWPPPAGNGVEWAQRVSTNSAGMKWGSY